MSRIRVLFDRNLEVHALRAEEATRNTNAKWGSHTVQTTIHGYRGKPLPSDPWLRRQIEALPTIAQMTRAGDIELCTTTELRFESFNAGRGWQGSIGDLFRYIKFTDVPAAIERSLFCQTVDLGEYASGASQAKWYREFLLIVDEEALLDVVRDCESVPDFDRQNVAKLTRFRVLCEHLETDDHIRDAFHLWTAEVNGLDYLLTADKRFINKMTKSTQLELPTPPIAPADLVESLGISKLDPQPLADQRFRPIVECDT